MSVSLMPIPKQAFFYVDNSGRQVPLVGGKVYTYLAGTSTPAATYTSSTGATANAWPVILDARGEASVWLSPGLYKIVLKDANDVEIYTQDGVSGTGLYTVFDDMDTLIANVGTFDGQLAFICGYHAVGDGGNGFFRWSAASTATDDKGITIKATASTTGRWIRVFDGDVNALWYGIKGDNLTVNDADLLNSASLAALNSRSRALHIPAGDYIIDGTFRFDSGITIRGDGTNSYLIYTDGDAPVMASRNWFASEGVSPVGRTHIRDLQLIGSANAAYTSNHCLVLRDYASVIDNVRASSAGGDGIRITHKNDAGTAVGGNMVENRVLNCTVTNANAMCYNLGEQGNGVLTDGYIINCVADGETGHTYGVYIGAAAGWTVNGIHTYGAVSTVSPVTLINSFFTNVSNLYIEAVGSVYGFNTTVQRSLNLSNINIRCSTAGVPALNIALAGTVTSAEVAASSIFVTNTSTNTVTAWDVSANVTVNLSAYASYNTTTGAITDFTGAGTIKTVADAIVMGALRESTNSIGLSHRGQYLALSAKKNFSPSNPAVSIAVDFDITTIRSYNSMVGTVHVNSRTNYNGTRRCTYMGQVYIQAKDNATDPWVVVMDTIITPAGFSSNPAATISNNTDGTGTLTITFTPSNTDDYGSVALLLTPGETT